MTTFLSISGNDRTASDVGGSIFSAQKMLVETNKIMVVQRELEKKKWIS